MKRIFLSKLIGAVAFGMALGSHAQMQAPSLTESAKMTPLQRAKTGKALWEEKCRTVAGEKIYRKVENVEGLLLMKVRPQASQRQWADPNWPGAAFALEARADEYINTFLGCEVAAGEPTGKPGVLSSKNRGFVTTGCGGDAISLSTAPGYRWVEVIDSKDGKRYRYLLVEKPRPTSKIGWIDIVLDKTPSPSPTSPRYGVTFDDHVIPDERYLGLASSTVKVIDLETKEVLGEMLRYAWSVPASSANPNPWLTAYKCPGHAVGASAATRKFVDQILIPTKDK